MLARWDAQSLHWWDWADLFRHLSSLARPQSSLPFGASKTTLRTKLRLNFIAPSKTTLECPLQKSSRRFGQKLIRRLRPRIRTPLIVFSEIHTPERSNPERCLNAQPGNSSFRWSHRACEQELAHIKRSEMGNQLRKGKRRRRSWPYGHTRRTAPPYQARTPWCGLGTE